MALRNLFRRRRPLEQGYIEGNRVELLVDGAAYFDAVLAAIQSAERYIFVEYYIVADDITGRRIADALIERAAAGIEVAFHYDWYGAIGLSTEYISRLQKAGVKVMAFRPPRFQAFWRLRRRNHRKMVIVDGKIGVVGGQNLSRDYDSPIHGGAGWRDTGVKVDGPAVAGLEGMFRQLWNREKGLPLYSPSSSVAAYPGGDPALFFGSYARRERAFIRKAYLLAILGAQKSIRITHAYFVPDRVLRRALVKAARRGVTIEIIVAGASDVPWARNMARALYLVLLKEGISIYEFHERVLHAKTAVFDANWSTVGSSNLDYMSIYWNLEVNAGIYGSRIAGALEDQFAVDRSRSRQIELRSWIARPWQAKLFESLFRLSVRWY